MPDTPDDKRIVKRRDPDGQLRFAPGWEPLIERQIQEAMAEGAFDRLPHQGEPLPNDDNPYAGEWGLAYHLLKNAGVAPPWIEADKEVRALLQTRDGILARAASGPDRTDDERRRDVTALEELVMTANAAIARVNAEAPTDRQRRPPLRLAEELARYDEARRRPRP